MKKILSDMQVEILKKVLLDVCVDEKPIPRSVIYKAFESIANSRLEEYRFNKALSDIIRADQIVGYLVKPGRSGGVMKTQPIERIELICSTGRYVGTITASELETIISSLKKR